MKFPLKDVSVREVAVARNVAEPAYADSYWQMNQREFAMQVEGVGSFYASDGLEVEYAPLPGVPSETVELYLNGSVYGAILHQRKILPLHGSSFIEQCKGVVLCGDSGAGKSSLALAFSLHGSQFLTDDVTPVIMKDDKPQIMAFSDRIKLWDHTLEQLKLAKDGLDKIFPDAEKFYYPMEAVNIELCPLKILFVIGVNDRHRISIDEITGTEKVVALRNEIYRPEYLKGMKENEAAFFHQIVDIIREVKVFQVKRPENIRIDKLMTGIMNCIAGQ